MAIIALLFFILSGRLTQLMVADAAWLSGRGERQWTRNVTLFADRGSIFDATDKNLAQTATTYTVSVAPTQVLAKGDAKEMANIFAEYLGLDAVETEAKIRDVSRASVLIKRQVDRDIVESLRALRQEHAERITAENQAKLISANNPLYGVYYAEDFKRYYPMAGMLAKTLGITTVDGIGQSGLEAYYNDEMTGENGSARLQVDGFGRDVTETEEVVPAIPGKSLKLTVDYILQNHVERILAECLTETGAKRVSAILMDVDTGGILAIAGSPGFDPNAPPRQDLELLQDVLRNRAVSDSYEPGALMGAFALAALIDGGKGDAVLHCLDVSADGENLFCWDENTHGEMSGADALARGCLTAFSEAALLLEKEEFYNKMLSFGFGSATGIDLPNETGGRLKQVKYVKDMDLARMGRGEGIAASPLQLLSAGSALVNGGKRMQPHIVSEILDDNGDILQQNQPVALDTPVSETTSATLKEMLTKNVAEGNGAGARVLDYTVGGIGGTARKYVDGKLSNARVSMFMAFAPMENPKLGVIVVVEEASPYPDYASALSAPYAGEILAQALLNPNMAIRPNAEPGVLEDVSMPDFTGKSVEDAVALAEEAGLHCLSASLTGDVRAQLPVAGTPLRKGDTVMVYSGGYPGELGTDYQVVVPDISGMGVYRAYSVIKENGLTLSIEGDGTAIRQSPAAGTLVDAGSTVQGFFEEIPVETVRPEEIDN